MYTKDKWYWTNGFNAIIRFKKMATINHKELFEFSESYDVNGYPISLMAINCGGRTLNEATTEQITQCLEAYAKRNGYVVNATFQHKHETNVYQVMQIKHNNTFIYKKESDEFVCSTGGTIYSNGMWSTIIKNDFGKPSSLIADGNISYKFAEWASLNYSFSKDSKLWISNSEDKHYYTTDRLFEIFSGIE